MTTMVVDSPKIAKLNAPMVDCHSRACGKPFDIETGVAEYLAAGVPANKIVLGLATYGRTFRLTPPATSSADAPPPGAAASEGKQVNTVHASEL